MALLTDIINSIIVKVNAKLNRSGDTMTGDLTVPNLHTAGLVDGRDVSADGTKLDTIETGATADQTPSEILSALVTVDGTGSGLDADLLDGLDSVQFLRSDVENTYTPGFLNLSHTAASISMDDQTAPDGRGIRRITCNDAGGNWNFRSGVYFKTGVGLSYTKAAFGATSITHWTDFEDGKISLYVAPKSVNADDLVTWTGTFEVTTTGIFFNGNKVWHAGNDGAGSGLDADLLDGLDSTQFLRSDVSGAINGTLSVLTNYTVKADTNTHLWFQTLANQTRALIYHEEASHLLKMRLYDLSTGTAVTSELIVGEAYNSSTKDFSLNGNNLINVGLVDSRDVSADGTTLDGLVSGTVKAGNADLLDGLSSTQFLRSDVENTYTPGFLNLSHTAASISMDDQTAPDGRGIRRITCNDGAGNWNFRSGVYFKTGVGLSYTKAGFGATSITLNSDFGDGSIQFYVAPKSLNADDPVTWASRFDVATTGIFFNGNTVWHAGNDGAGSGLDADLIHGKTLQTTFDQIFYVDAVNGNDLNDGSSTAPFATLNKAVDSITVGGRGIIYLLSDITVLTAILAKKKDIYMSGVKSDGTKSIITFNTYALYGYNTLAGFRIADGCNIGFKNCTINFDLTGIDPNLTFDMNAQVVSYPAEAASLTSVRLSLCDVNLPDDSNYALVHSNGAGSMIALSMYSTTVNSAGVNSFLAKITAGSLIYNSYSVTLSGAKTVHADVISGIIRDVNGLPRNILSNIIF